MTATPTLLGLPGEIRNNIYELVTFTDTVKVRDALFTHGTQSFKPHPLAHVCQQTSREFAELYDDLAPYVAPLEIQIKEFDFTGLLIFLKEYGMMPEASGANTDGEADHHDNASTAAVVDGGGESDGAGDSELSSIVERNIKVIINISSLEAALAKNVTPWIRHTEHHFLPGSSGHNAAIVFIYDSSYTIEYEIRPAWDHGMWDSCSKVQELLAHHIGNMRDMPDRMRMAVATLHSAVSMCHEAALVDAAREKTKIGRGRRRAEREA